MPRTIHVGLSRLWLTLAIGAGILLARIVRAQIACVLRRTRPHSRVVFWTDQAASLAALAARGKTFTVGDRIKMSGVRGDVVSLGFLQTRIMEMASPPM